MVVLLADPTSLAVSREGIFWLEPALNNLGPAVPVIAIEATAACVDRGSPNWEPRHPGSVRLFAPSETKSAGTQLGSGRFKTDHCDSAALTYMAGQGGGRRYGRQASVEAPRAAVRHRRGLWPTARSLSSGCTTSSTPCVLDCRRPPVKVDPWRWVRHAR
jgi:hypothetical protein